VSTPETALHRSGTGTPLLLLHGASITWRTWKPVLRYLEPRHDVIAPTMLGHSGGTPLNAGTPLSIQGLVDDVTAGLDRLGLDRVHVAGNSLGGWVGLELARQGRALSFVGFSPGGAWRSPTRYRAISVAMDTGVRMMSSLGDRSDWLATSPRGRRLAGRLACVDPARLDPDEFRADLRALRATPALRGLMQTIGATPFRPLPDPGCPIRIVWARRDRVVPFRSFGQPLMERLPTAELVFLDGVGHVPMLDRPKEVAALILEVTSSVDRAAPQRTELSD
jgi:pimeloyl-ACP methyl ester carboxylesterase